ncbi:MAG: M14 family metallopeptidase [Candidatus Cloacimonetes bacterium]|nr:M14 family metallopeptidase [Candidatus Cloacimonadota bacterium]MCK9332930.1 M14 family metallopeptidase [Candidatus Cloacimonadota bacterium]MDY0299392.1 M14 family metallopeptidase [Candidatus Cloacimonadaceae bacterium]
MNFWRAAIALCSIMLMASCAFVGTNQYPLSSAYPRFDDILPHLNELAAKYPAVMKHRIIGFSTAENLPIYAAELGKGKRNILIIGQHHADEVLGLAISMYMIEQLSREYFENKSIHALLDEYSIWIVPTLNPEGYRLVSSGQSRIKRKNNRDTDGNGKLDIRSDGVDLNRNYPIFWDLDPEIDHMSSFYKGDAPASEEEIKAIIALSRRVFFEFAIFYHSSLTGELSERIFLPAISDETDKYSLLQKQAKLYAKNVERDYHSGTYTIHTGISSQVGNARNFFYHSVGTSAMLIEVGGVDQKGKSIIHPTDRMVKSINKRHLKAFVKLLDYMSKIST